MNVYFNPVTHAIYCDEGKRITSILLPKEIDATEVLRCITSLAFIPVIEAMTKTN